MAFEIANLFPSRSEFQLESRVREKQKPQMQTRYALARSPIRLRSFKVSKHFILVRVLRSKRRRLQKGGRRCIVLR